MNGRFFAPLAVPMHRRRQTFAMVMWLAILPICVLVFLGYLATTAFALLFMPPIGACLGLALLWYGVQIALRHPYRHGRRFHLLTNSIIFRTISSNFASYFPAVLRFDGIKGDATPAAVSREVFLPGERYLLCCHPHGLFGYGVWGSFVAHLSTGGHRFFDEYVHSTTGTNRHKFELRIHTMTVNFKIPVWRDWLLSLGFCDVDKRTLISAMSADTRPSQKSTSTTSSKHDKKSPRSAAPVGKISCLVPGGAAESVDCDAPILTLRNRKGFVKIALQTGCHLVPVYTFGETKLYRAWTDNSKIKTILRKIQKMMGVGTPLVVGRGIFNYGFGFLPHRQPLTTVVGKPISVPCMGDSFTQQDVDKYHGMYMDALMQLYRDNKPLYDATSQDLVLK